MVLATSLFSLFFFVGCDDDPAPTDVVPHEHAAAVLEVTAAEATLDVGETLGLETSARCDCGEQLHPALAWSSADRAIATVDETGTVQAVATGTTTLTAAVNGLEETTVVEVTDGVVGTLDEQGGEITSPDGGLTLVVPEGALDGPTEIRLAPVPDAEFAGDDAFVPGTAYRCSPDGLAFGQAVRVRDRYDPERIPGDADQDRLRLHLRERLHDGSGDGDQYRWHQMERGRVMTQARMVEGDVGACGTLAIRVQSQHGDGPGGPQGPNSGSAQSDRSGGIRSVPAWRTVTAQASAAAPARPATTADAAAGAVPAAAVAAEARTRARARAISTPTWSTRTAAPTACRSSARWRARVASSPSPTAPCRTSIRWSTL